MGEDNQNINDTTQTKQSSGAEKVEKAGNAAAGAVKKGKFLAKLIKSLKGLGALGVAGIVIIIVIIALIVIIGIVGFFLEMPGLITNKVSEIATAFCTELKTYYEGNSARFGSEPQKELAEYLTNMGYSPYEFGFGRYTDEDGNYIEDGDSDDATMNSKYLNAYLTADYNTYVPYEKFKSGVSKLLHVIGDAVGYVLGMETEKDTGEPQFGMLHFDSGMYENADGDDLNAKKMNFLDSVDADVESKTLTFTVWESLFTRSYYTYNMEGWTARYGKPLELSLTLHLATMAPDLVYRFDMDSEESTEIHISTIKSKATIKFEYHVNNVPEEGTNFAGVDESLADIDNHIQGEDHTLTVEDLQTLKDYIDEHDNSDMVDRINAGYENLKAFIDSSIDTANNRHYLEINETILQAYDAPDNVAWWNDSEAIEYMFNNGGGLFNNEKSIMDSSIEKIKEQYPDAEFYTDEVGKSYSEIVGKTVHSVEDSTGTYEDGATTGIMNEFYLKYSEAKSDGDFTEDEQNEVYEFLQDKLEELLPHVEADIQKIKEYDAETEEKLKDFNEELDKIGLTITAINDAIDYNNDGGQGQGTEINRVQPYITKVIKHWYRDVIFKDTTGEYNYYDAYDVSESQATYENVFNPVQQSDDSSLAPNDKGAFYTIETVGAGSELVQARDAIRGAVNEHTKELFIGTEDRPAKYFIYDGSTKTAEKIDELRKVYDEAYSASWDIIQSDSIARQAAEDAVEAKEKADGTDFYKEVNVRQNALSAFSILENSKTEDSEYILRDLKKLFVELGYFTKDDLREDDTHVFQWPISGYINTYWPQRRFEKQQADYGTLIRSKASTDNIRAGLNADGSERTEEQTQAYIYEANFNADTTGAVSDDGVPDLDDEDADESEEETDEVSNPTDTLIDGFESGLNVVSPVTGEILEEGDDYIKIKVLDTSAVSEYEEFYNEYKGICTGYIMYIRGFQKGTIDANSVSEYQKVTHTDRYFIEMGFADDYTEVEPYATAFEEAEQKRVDAPAYLEKDGKRYIKEGTVLGTTTGSDLGLYLMNRENSMVEDVESYVRLVKKGIDTEFPEEFIFWLGVELEGACEGQYDLGDSYGVEVLADGAGNTTAFGLTKAVAQTGEVPNMYPQFAEHLASGRVPKKEAQDVFVLVLEAARETVLEKITNQNALSESMLDALVDLHHASPSECYQIIEVFNQKNTLTVQDFEDHWGTNTNYETQLRGRGHVRGVLAVDEEYRNPYDQSFPKYTFNTETPWTDFINGTPSSEIATLG